MTAYANTLNGTPANTRRSAASNNATIAVRHFVARTWAVLQPVLALLGIAFLAVILLLAIRSQWRAELGSAIGDWLSAQQEQVQSPAPESTAVSDRVLVADLEELPEEQARVAQWLARKYRVASQPLAALVTEAYRIGPQLRLDPALILAVMAIESRFNPFAASPWGAHGLMQVHTRVHAEKFEPFGGVHAAFDPLSNLRVGAQILHDVVRQAGSIPGGLRLYVGAVTTDATDYIAKVLSEYERIKRVSSGARVGFQAAVPLPAALMPTPSATPAAKTDPAPLEAEATPEATGVPADTPAS